MKEKGGENVKMVDVFPLMFFPMMKEIVSGERGASQLHIGLWCAHL